MKKNLGFTLVELLAVIVVLGIILVIAIPSITGTIDGAKKDSYVSSAKMLKDNAVTIINTATGMQMPTVVDTATLIPVGSLNMENLTNDPFGDAYEAANSYVMVAKTAAGYDYYITLQSGNGNMGIVAAELSVIDEGTVKSLSSAHTFLSLMSSSTNTINPDLAGDGAAGGTTITVVYECSGNGSSLSCSAP